MPNARVPTIIQFDIGAHSQRSTFFNALVACLNPEEKCDVLLRSPLQPYTKRAIVVRRVIADIQLQELPCHVELVRHLQTRLEATSSKERITYAKLLLEIAENMGGEFLETLANDLMLSQSREIRKQVLRRFKANSRLGLPAAILTSWERYGDLDAARLVIDRASIVTLTHRFVNLEEAVLREGWLLARLYLRLQGAPPATLARLRKLDPITHAYVALKLGKPVRRRQLVDAYGDHMFDERSGLLVWCAGQMGQWNTVRQMQDLYENPPEKVRNRYHRALGFTPDPQM